MLAGALLAAALAIVGWSLLTGRGLPRRIAALFGRTTRSGTMLGWAAGTVIAFGGTSLAALALLVRIDAVWHMPHELRMAAWSLGLPAEADAGTLLWLGGTLIVGIALGVALTAVQRRRGRRPIGLPYRSPAEARGPGERLPAAAIALAAGIGEELFFRLLLPLLIAIVLGSALLGFAVALVAFAGLHRHQGWPGMIAVALVGGWLTYLYLLTGALWLVAMLHVLIDLHALVLRPWASNPVSS